MCNTCIIKMWHSSFSAAFDVCFYLHGLQQGLGCVDLLPEVRDVGMKPHDLQTGSATALGCHCSQGTHHISLLPNFLHCVVNEEQFTYGLSTDNAYSQFLSLLPFYLPTIQPKSALCKLPEVFSADCYLPTLSLGQHCANYQRYFQHTVIH